MWSITSSSNERWTWSMTSSSKEVSISRCEPHSWLYIRCDPHPPSPPPPCPQTTPQISPNSTLKQVLKHPQSRNQDNKKIQINVAYIRKNIVHFNHIFVIITQLRSKSTYFAITYMLVLCVILIASPCSHICDYKKGSIIFLLWMQLWLMTGEVFVENIDEKWQYIIQFWLLPLTNDIIDVFATIMVIFATTQIKFAMYTKKHITHACGKLC